MNPGIGAPELLVIAIIALVVVGPKELPLMVRRIGRFMGHIRGIARDFQKSFDDLGREAELSELRKEVQALKNVNPMNEVREELNKAANEADNAARQERSHPRVAATETPVADSEQAQTSPETKTDSA
jgi:sec-independent protein translocase protein TatB